MIKYNSHRPAKNLKKMKSVLKHDFKELIMIFLLISSNLLVSPSSIACIGFCDKRVEIACNNLYSSKNKEQAATAAISVVRAYDKLALTRNEFRSENYEIDKTSNIYGWCSWATGK